MQGGRYFMRWIDGVPDPTDRDAMGSEIGQTSNADDSKGENEYANEDKNVCYEGICLVSQRIVHLMILKLTRNNMCHHSKGGLPNV